MARRNVSLPDELNDKLDQPHLNASGLIQDLLRAYFAYGDAETAAEFAFEKRTGDREHRRTQACEALVTALENNPETFDKFNEGVLRQASKLEMPPEAVVEMVHQYAETGEVLA